MRWRGLSLRSKLVLACLAVQCVAGMAAFAMSARTLGQTLADQAVAHQRQVVAMLEQTIATPLVQRDYATLQQSLDLLRADDALTYVVLRDHRDRVIASSGWHAAKALPPRDGRQPDLGRADATWHLAAPLQMAGQSLGRIEFGLSTAAARTAQHAALQRSAIIGLLAMLVSLSVLAAIAYAVTRHVARLSVASQAVADGRYDIHIPVASDDEIGRLAHSFNHMAAALKQRVAALQDSELRQRQHVQAVQQEQSRLTTLLGAMGSGILFVDAQGGVLYANTAFARIWSIGQPQAGEPVADIVAALERQVLPADVLALRALAEPAATDPSKARELHLLDGRTVTQRAQPVSAGPQHGGWIWFHEDVTLERQLQQRAQQALHDPLTRLLNRRGLYESLQVAIAAAALEAQVVTVMFVDLDDFKHANDVGGHKTGDEVLVAVAHTLAAHMRRGELVARLGGDEFAVVCPGLAGDARRTIAERLVQAVSELQFQVADQMLGVGCSIGVASYPDDATEVEELVACADRAMYKAKQRGKNTVAVYQDAPQSIRAEQAGIDWGARLHRALADERFILHFQPVRRAADLSVAHHEALLRLRDEHDPQRLISPAEFIGHAERSGKILAIDRWVFEQCVRQLAHCDAGVRIAANLSIRSLEDGGFAAFLGAALQTHDVDPRRLHIELTETAAIGDSLAARDAVRALRALGCNVHLDDFGSGFNSFAQLKWMEVDAIKIDGTFVRDMVADQSSRLFVASMIEIAHSLGKLAIAEHVEDAAALDLLHEMGADLVQGFHLGRPGVHLLEEREPGRLQLVVGDFKRTGGGNT